jgi:hypothetical protein
MTTIFMISPPHIFGRMLGPLQRSSNEDINKK